MFNAGTLLFCGFLLLSATVTAQNILTTPLSSSEDHTARVITTSGASSLNSIHKDNTTIAADLISFAQSLKGIPYRYACSDPLKGFDCSGFVMYVFNRFHMRVPRSSIDFTHFGKEMDLQHSKPGDIILFTGTDSSKRKVGHVGIITQVSDGVTFIHSSSGKTQGVIETMLNSHYKERFVKVIRVLP
jgi:cell wall-associated NlpC family hydrolase